MCLFVLLLLFLCFPANVPTSPTSLLPPSICCFFSYLHTETETWKWRPQKALWARSAAWWSPWGETTQRKTAELNERELSLLPDAWLAHDVEPRPATRSKKEEANEDVRERRDEELYFKKCIKNLKVEGKSPKRTERKERAHMWETARTNGDKLWLPL